jgi:5-methylcytosine-specific restriction endonuclease McrA
LGDRPEMDHIYPVVRGGLSEPANLVYVCCECNSRKHDMTLREFAIAYGLDRVRIESVLARLGKRF